MSSAPAHDLTPFDIEPGANRDENNDFQDDSVDLDNHLESQVLLDTADWQTTRRTRLCENPSNIRTKRLLGAVPAVVLVLLLIFISDRGSRDMNAAASAGGGRFDPFNNNTTKKERQFTNHKDKHVDSDLKVDKDQSTSSENDKGDVGDEGVSKDKENTTDTENAEKSSFSSNSTGGERDSKGNDKSSTSGGDEDKDSGGGEISESANKAGNADSDSPEPSDGSASGTGPFPSPRPPAPTPNVLIPNPKLAVISPSPTNTAALMITSSPTPALTDTRAMTRPPLPTVQSSNGNHATLIMAYYYTWYKQGNWSSHGHVGTPELGLYGTDSSSVAEKHIEWASGAIDAFVVSWNGVDHYATQHLEKGLLKARNLNQIKFCVFYESLGRLAELNGTVYDRIDFGEPEIMDRFIQDFKHLKETYFSHEQYLKLNDGRPVVSLYVTRIFDNFNRTHIERVENELGMKLFIIADETFIDSSNDPLTSPNGINGDNGESVFDAYTAYNMFEDENVMEGESALSYMQREAWPIFERWAKKTRFFPHVLPSYHDFRGHKPLTGGKEGLLTQLETMECLPKPKGQIPYMMFLTSFNEWWEGTTVEPTKEYGTDYLDTLREYRSNKMPCN